MSLVLLQDALADPVFTGGLHLSVPLGMALIMFYNLTKYEDDHRLAWTLATFFAGLGGLGIGSIVVALLYHTVE